MPAARRSTRISDARAAVSTAPISNPSPTAERPAAPPAEPSTSSASSSSGSASPSPDPAGPPVQQYKVKNPDPFPEGDPYLDLGSFGSGYIRGIETCPEGGEGYPAARFQATIRLRSSGSSTGEEIGYVKARLLKTHDEEEPMDFQEMCDDLSGELHALASILFDEDGGINDPFWEWLGGAAIDLVLKSGDILYIEEVLIKKRYRGYGVGLLAVRQLMEQIPAFGQMVVITSPGPLNPRMFAYGKYHDPTDPFAQEGRVDKGRAQEGGGEEAHVRAQRALEKYYASIGFMRMTTEAQEARTYEKLQFWGLWMGNVLPDIEKVVPHLF